jgi:hypothetical protein
MSTSPFHRAIPAAAGYPQYSGNLMHPLVSQNLLERFTTTTVFGAISSTEYTGELVGRGDKITFFKAPEVAVRNSVKGGVIKHDTLTADTHTMVIDRACEWSVKIALLDERMMGMWEKMRAGMVTAAADALAQKQDRDLLGSIYLDADPDNFGSEAGTQTHAYDLGDIGAPIILADGEDISKLLSRLHGVLNEQYAPRQNRFVVMPPIAETYLLQSSFFALIGHQGGYSPDQILNGMMAQKVMGFSIYVSHNTASIIDPITSARCFYIISGLPMATAWASVVEETRILDTDPNSWDKYFQGLLAYGFDVLYPKALAVAYVTFDTSDI